MELALFVYLAGVTESIQTLFSLACVLGLIALPMCWVFLHNEKQLNKFKTWWITVVISCGIISSFIPSEKTMYMMAGAYAAQTVAASSVASKTLELIESKIETELSNLKKKEK